MRASMLRAMVLGVAAVLFCGTARAADEPANHLDLAKAAVADHHYAAAVDHLQQFAKGSIVEPRADEGRDLVLKIAAEWSADLERQQKTPLAARAVVRCAEALGDDPQADELRTRARQMLEVGYEKAMNAKDPGSALGIATAANKLFPEAPMASAASIKILEVGALARQVGKARPEYLYQRYRALEADGVLAGVFEEHKLHAEDLLLAYAKELQDRGWYAEEIRLLREALASDTAPAQKPALQAALAQAAVTRADAAISLGNTGQANDALSLCQEIATSIEAAQIERLKLAVQKLGPAGDPAAFPTGETIVGNATWKDSAGVGYQLDGVVQTGNSHADRGGDWIDANVVAEAGFCLEGGTLRASKGVLEFNGTPDKPIILRKVKIECDYVATVKARFTIFEDCVFTKSGNWFWNDGYSSKWEFTDCLVQRSHFAKLTKIDYGVKLTRCTFDRCKFPPRLLTTKPGEDGAAVYGGEWNHVDDCDFFHCDLHPSVAWSTRGCNFYQCTFSGRAAFASKTSLDAQLGLPAEEADAVDDLIAATTTRAAGAVIFSRSNVSFPRATPAPLWKWAADASLRADAPTP